MNLTKDIAFIKIAQQLAELSTCPRRSVGCVLVDRNYRIIGSGYNGVPRGVIHCTDQPCPHHRKSTVQHAGLLTLR